MRLPNCELSWKQRQENEQLRMQVEDLRQAQFSHVPDIFSRSSRSRCLTWRELSRMEHQKIVYLNHEVIAPALDTLEEARRDIRMREGFPYIPGLVEVYNAICDAEQRLRDEGSEEAEDDEEAEEGEISEQ